MENHNADWIIEFNEELNAEYKFLNDSEYKNIKKLTTENLKSENFYERYIEMLKQLKDILKEDPIKIFGEGELVRHLFGWKGDMEGCRDSLVTMLEWRKSTNPETLTFEKDFAIYQNINFKELIEIKTYDVYGRPVLKFSPRHLNPKILTIELLSKYLTFIMESVIKLIPCYLDKFILFVDLSSVGLANVSVEHLKKVNEFTRKYYVERLAKIYIINKGFFFSVIWKVVSAFLDQRILKKLIVVDTSHKSHLDYLLGGNFNLIGINL